MAEAFAQAAAKDIIVIGRRLDVLEKAKTSLTGKYAACNVVAESCDVSNEQAVDELFAKLRSHGIEVDVLVNNAGVNTDRNLIKESNVENWWRAYVSIMYYVAFNVVHRLSYTFNP